MNYKMMYQFLGNRWFLGLLFIINFLGTIYGYYWYRNQIADTPIELLVFVPDSPTASLFFTLVIFLLLLGKRSSFIAAFAAITSFKYGVWAVVAILWGQALGDQLYPQHYMLILSHLGMAAEGLLFYAFYRIRLVHLITVAAWVLLNDFFDYFLGVHPWTAYELMEYETELGWVTMGLSLLSITIVALLVSLQRNKHSA